jgi:hypothetical protein
MQLMIDRGLDGNHFLAKNAHFCRAFVGVNPDTLHIRDDLATTVAANTTTCTVAKVLRTGHRTDHACCMQYTLAAHFAVEKHPLAEAFNRCQPACCSFIAHSFDDWVHPANCRCRNPIRPLQQRRSNRFPNSRIHDLVFFRPQST